MHTSISSFQDRVAPSGPLHVVPQGGHETCAIRLGCMLHTPLSRDRPAPLLDPLIGCGLSSRAKRSCASPTPHRTVACCTRHPVDTHGSRSHGGDHSLRGRHVAQQRASRVVERTSGTRIPAKVYQTDQRDRSTGGRCGCAEACGRGGDETCNVQRPQEASPFIKH